MTPKQVRQQTIEALDEFPTISLIARNAILALVKEAYMIGHGAANTYKNLRPGEVGMTMNQIKNHRYKEKHAKMIPCPKCDVPRMVRPNQKQDSLCKSCNGKARGVDNMGAKRVNAKPPVKKIVKEKKDYVCTDCKDPIKLSSEPVQPFVCTTCKKIIAKAKKIREREALEKPRNRETSGLVIRDFSDSEKDMIAKFNAKKVS